MPLKRSEQLPMEGRVKESELEIIEAVLLHILQEEYPLPAERNSLRKAKLTRKLHDLKTLTSDDQLCPVGAEDLTNEDSDQDFRLLSKLLKQVQIFKAEKDKLDISLNEYHGLPAQENMQYQQNVTERNVEDLRKTVELNAEVAASAAEVAKAAADAATKSLEAMESLLAISKKSKLRKDSSKASCRSEALKEEDGEGEGAIEEDVQVKKIVKVVQKQNKITHWILAFMVITTAIWRFKAVSLVLGVQKTICNPFRAIGDIFSNGFKGSTKEGPNDTKALQKAGKVLPSLLQGKDDETKAHFEQMSAEEHKVSEGPTFPLDNLLSVGNSSNHEE